jgi:hypothetical protein
MRFLRKRRRVRLPLFTIVYYILRIFPARSIVKDLHIFGHRPALELRKSVGSDISREPVDGEADPDGE